MVKLQLLGPTALSSGTTDRLEAILAGPKRVARFPLQGTTAEQARVAPRTWAVQYSAQGAMTLFELIGIPVVIDG